MYEEVLFDEDFLFSYDVNSFCEAVGSTSACNVAADEYAVNAVDVNLLLLVFDDYILDIVEHSVALDIDYLVYLCVGHLLYEPRYEHAALEAYGCSGGLVVYGVFGEVSVVVNRGEYLVECAGQAVNGVGLVGYFAVYNCVERELALLACVVFACAVSVYYVDNGLPGRYPVVFESLQLVSRHD